MYDWIIDIDLVTNIARQGWKLTLSPNFFKNNQHLFRTKKAQVEISKNAALSDDYDPEKIPLQDRPHV